MAEHEALKGKIVGLLGGLLLRGRGNMLKSLMDSWKAENAVDRRERLESLSAAFRDDPELRPWIQQCKMTPKRPVSMPPRCT